MKDYLIVILIWITIISFLVLSRPSYEDNDRPDYNIINQTY